MLEAMAAIPLHPALTRAEADAALAEAAPDPVIRAFLLQNLRFSGAPEWRIGLSGNHRGAARYRRMAARPAGMPYPGPTLFIAGARSDYIRPQDRAEIRDLFPNARFVTLKNAGHWVHADNPSGFVGVLEAFLG